MVLPVRFLFSSSSLPTRLTAFEPPLLPSLFNFSRQPSALFPLFSSLPLPTSPFDSSNFGRGRRLPPHPSFHFTVKQRLDAHATDFAVIGGGGNNENFPEGEHYHYAAKLRKGERGQEVNFVE